MSNRTMHIFAWASVLLAGSSAAAAPANGVSGPVSGFVVDGRSHALRPINGLPGSATLGSPLQLPFSPGLTAGSASLDYAIVTDFHGTGQPFVVRGLASGTPTVSQLANGIVASQAAISGSGTAALLYSQPDTKLQFVTGLPGQPQASSPVDLSALNDGVAAMAMDVAGRTALLIAGDGGLYWTAANGQGPQFIVRIAGAGSASILPNGQDAVVGNRDNGDVLLIRGFAGSATVSTLTGARDGITSVAAVRALNTHEAGIVDGSGRLGIVNVDTAAVSWMGLAGRADRLEPLDSNLVLLNQPGTGPLLLLDLSQGRTTYFVPPDGTSDVQLHKGIDTWKR